VCQEGQLLDRETLLEKPETALLNGSVLLSRGPSSSRTLENLNFCPFLRPFGFDDNTIDYDDPSDIIARG